MPGKDPNSNPGSQSGVRPKVLFSEETEGVTEVTKVTPTIREESGVKPKVIFGEVKETKTEPSVYQEPKPKKIAEGNIRKRIPCTKADLLFLDAKAPDGVMVIAMRIVMGINLEDAYFEDSMNLGAKLQAEHGVITEGELATVKDATFQQAQTYLAQMLQLIAELDPNKVFGVKSGMVEKLGRIFSAQVSPDLIFQEKYPRLELLAKSLKNLEVKLKELVEQLRIFKQRYLALVDDTAGYSLAATYIANYVHTVMKDDVAYEHYAAQANALETRAASLLATRVTIATGRITNDMLQESIQSLIDTGRDMLEVDLPAFRTAYAAAVIALSQSEKLQGDEITAVNTVYELITKKLNPTKGAKNL